MTKIFLSVVIPCYNEERNLRLGVLESVTHFLEKKGYPWELIVVDDGSSDKSVNFINDSISDHNNVRLIKNRHQGKAGTVITGMLEAKGHIILFTDLDQATPINEIDNILPWFEKNYDVVIGSRSHKRQGAPIFRIAMARGFMILRDIILNLGIADTQCGFKAFTQAAATKIFSQLQIFRKGKVLKDSTVTAGFDVELLFIAKNLGYKIKEVSVDWHYQETGRVDPLKDSLRGLVALLRIRINALRGLYK